MDAKGDGPTLAKKIGLNRVPWIAFPLKISADVILFVDTPGIVGRGLAMALFLSDIVCALLWRSLGLRAAIVQVMRLQSVAGIYYLF